METKKVSVIVPVFNAEKYLGDCLKSILRQTYKNLSIILVNDGSTDGSADICSRYEEKDTRILVIHRSRCSGVSRARNLGLENADGEYVCFVDADDILEKDYIKKMVGSLSIHRVPAVFGRHRYLLGDKIKKRASRISQGIYRSENISSRLIDDGTVTGILFGSVCGAIYDLKFLKGNAICFDESLRKNEDGVFNLKLVSLAHSIYVSDYDGYIYRKWKDKEKRPLFRPDKELERATKVIRNKFSYFKDFDVQMKRREVSVVFWNAITIGNCMGGFFRNKKRLKRYIKNSSLEDSYPSLNLADTSFFKRFLIRLLYRRRIFMFCLLMKYIFPLLSRFR